MTALNKKYLQELGITHVLNANTCLKPSATNATNATITTNATFYKDVNMKFLGICLDDKAEKKIEEFFNVGSIFIRKGLASGGLSSLYL